MKRIFGARLNEKAIGTDMVIYFLTAYCVFYKKILICSLFSSKVTVIFDAKISYIINLTNKGNRK